MTVVLDSAAIPPAERVDALREIITSTVVQVEIGFAPAPASAVGTVTKLGPLTICSVRSTAVTVKRTPQLAAADDVPSIFVGMQLAGSSLVVQHGREAVLRPGELVIYDTTAPYSLIDSVGFRQHFFRIPLDRLALPHDLVRRISAVTMGPDHPVADLAATYLRRLAERTDLSHLPAADVISRQSIELVRAAITTRLEAVGPASDSLQRTQALRILEYARSHLGDHDLSAAKIASAQHISTRQLYKVLAAEGVALGDWVRNHRLDECRREIADPRSRFTSIGAVARHWGFTDPSTFSRLFRTAYGVSPRDWRKFQTAHLFE